MKNSIEIRILFILCKFFTIIIAKTHFYLAVVELYNCARLLCTLHCAVQFWGSVCSLYSGSVLTVHWLQYELTRESDCAEMETVILTVAGTDAIGDQLFISGIYRVSMEPLPLTAGLMLWGRTPSVCYRSYRVGQCVRWKPGIYINMKLFHLFVIFPFQGITWVSVYLSYNV